MSIEPISPPAPPEPVQDAGRRGAPPSRGDEPPSRRRGAPLVLRGATEPYGYSVTLWTCSALLADANGRPGRLAIALFAAGALLGFGLTNVLLARAAEWTPAQEWSLLRSLHVGPVLTAVGGTLAATALFGSELSWSLGGLIASSAYFGGVCVEHRLIS